MTYIKIKEIEIFGLDPYTPVLGNLGPPYAKFHASKKHVKQKQTFYTYILVNFRKVLLESKGFWRKV